MADIDVDCEPSSDGWSCAVRVREGGGETNHTVSVPESDWEELTGGQVDVEQLVESSFQFLLDREPKESIMSRFDIMTIARYFPEYPDTVTEYLP